MRVPDGWQIIKIGSLARNVTSGSRDWAQYYSDSGSKFVRMTNLRRDGIHLKLDDLKYVKVNNDSTDGKRTALQAGDILISITAELGKIGWIPENFGEAFINQHTALVRINRQKAESKYIAYLLSSNRMNGIINRMNDAGAKAGLNLPTIKGIPVPVPPLPEQQKIAQILSTWDKAIEKLEALIAAKQKRKKALMQQLLTGKKRFAGFEGEWKEYKLGDIDDKKKKWSFTGGPFGSNLKAQDYTESGVRIIQLQNIGDGKFLDDYKIYTSAEKANELLSCNIYPGDIIISKMGDPVARACFIPNSTERFLMASDGIRLAVDEEKFNKKFVHDSINFRTFRKKAIKAGTGSTRQRIGLDDLRKLTLFVPSIEEQQKIASFLSDADKEIETHQKQLSALKQQKKGLMQQLLTGKKRVKIVEPEQRVAVGA